MCQCNGAAIGEGQELGTGDRCSLSAGQIYVVAVARGDGVVSRRAFQLYNIVASASVYHVSRATQDDGVVAATGGDVVVTSTSYNSVVAVASYNGVIAVANVDVRVLIAINGDHVVAFTSVNQELDASVSSNSNASQGSRFSGNWSVKGYIQASAAIEYECFSRVQGSRNFNGNQVSSNTRNVNDYNVSSAFLTGRNLWSIDAIPACQVNGISVFQVQQSADRGSGVVGDAGVGQKRLELGACDWAVVLHVEFLILQAIWPVLLIFCFNAEFSHGDL